MARVPRNNAGKTSRKAKVVKPTTATQKRDAESYWQRPAVSRSDLSGMSREQLEQAYLDDDISRRIFLERLELAESERLNLFRALSERREEMLRLRTELNKAREAASDAGVADLEARMKHAEEAQRQTARDAHTERGKLQHELSLVTTQRDAARMQATTLEAELNKATVVIQSLHAVIQTITGAVSTAGSNAALQKIMANAEVRDVDGKPRS